LTKTNAVLFFSQFYGKAITRPQKTQKKHKKTDHPTKSSFHVLPTFQLTGSSLKSYRKTTDDILSEEINKQHIRLYIRAN